MPPKKGNAGGKETPVKTSGVLTRSQAAAVERTRTGMRTRTASSSLGPDVWSDPPDIRRRRRRARIDNAAEAPEVAPEEANPVEEEVPNSGQGVVAIAEEVKSVEEEVPNSGQGVASKAEEVKSGVDEAVKSVEENVQNSGQVIAVKAEEVKSGGDEAMKSVKEEVPNSGQGVAAKVEAAKSNQDEVEGLAVKSVEEESLPVTYSVGQASSSKGKAKGKKVKKILINHCMHSGDLFKTKAAEVKTALEDCGRFVRIDTKIRRGSFQVREVGGVALFQLMDMREPYQELVNLDVQTIVTAAAARL